MIRAHASAIVPVEVLVKLQVIPEIWIGLQHGIVAQRSAATLVVSQTKLHEATRQLLRYLPQCEIFP